MQYRAALLIMAFLFGVGMISMSLASDSTSIHGSFNGQLTPEGCRPGPPYLVSGKVIDRRVTLYVMKNEILKMTLSDANSFKGEAFLRPHRLGEKIQVYRGSIRNGKVHIDAWFGIKGFTQGSCTAKGKLTLH